MQIKTNSWHFRLLKFTDFYPEDNLCPYMREVVAATVLISAATITMTYPVWQIWQSDGSMAVASMLCWCVAGVLMLKGYREEWRASMFYAGYNSQDQHGARGMFDTTKFYHKQLIHFDMSLNTARPKHANIFVERVRAAHHKICPGLEFKDGE